MTQKVEGIKKQLNTFKQAAGYFKETIFNGLKDKISGQRRRHVVTNALSFSRTHKDCLVIIGDTKKDDIVLAYNGHYAVTKVVSKFFRKGQKIIKSIVCRTEKDDRVAEHKVSEFLGVLDAFLFNFSKNLNQPKVASANTNQNNKIMEDEEKTTPDETPETPAEETSAK